MVRVAIAAMALLALSAPVWAAEWRFGVPLEGHREATVVGDLVHATVAVGPGAGVRSLAEVAAVDPQDAEPVFRREGDRLRWHARGEATAPQRWDVRLSDRVRWRFDQRLARGQFRYDLGGLAVERLTLQASDAELAVGWNGPNRSELAGLWLHLGAGQYAFDGLGHAKIRDLVLSGGNGAYRFDFSGDLHGRVRGRLRLTSGTLHLRVPEAVGVKLVRHGWFTHFALPEDLRASETSANYAQAGSVLELEVDVNFGQVVLERI